MRNTAGSFDERTIELTKRAREKELVQVNDSFPDAGQRYPFRKLASVTASQQAVVSDVDIAIPPSMSAVWTGVFQRSCDEHR